nr:putative ribonuclease H-like domain-containing protein [Tanacetum cinerariifolium]
MIQPEPEGSTQGYPLDSVEVLRLMKIQEKSKCKYQEKEDNVKDNVNSTNNVNTVSLTVNAAGTNEVNVVGGTISIELPFDPNMHALENISIFDFSNNDEDDDAMADMKNLDTTIQVRPILTKRIHKDHPLDQVIEDLHSATQTRKMPKNLEEHRFIEEEVYVCQLPGFEDPNFPDRVYKVEKALYGLHQAPRAWYETLSTYLLDNMFQREKIYKTLFIKRYKGDILLVQVYVDDIIFGSTKKELCIAFEKMMNKKFQMKVKTGSIIMETQKSLLKDENGEEVDVHMHRYQVNPNVSHFHAMKRIFRKPTRKNTQAPQPSGSTKNVTDEAVHKELGDSLVRVATTASSLKLEHDSARVESSRDEESLGKDASKQERRIDAIDADKDIPLVSVQNDAKMFDVSDLSGEEAKGIIFQEPGESTTTITTTTISLKQSQDKGKGKMVEEPVKAKKKDQTRLDEEAALKLQAEFDEEVRLAREKAGKEQEANIALIETWDDIQAKINDDHQLAKRFQAQKQKELSDTEKATLFMQLLEKRRKYFVAKKAEEERNTPPTQAQKRKIICIYLKSMEGYTLKQLKVFDFDKIQEMFDQAFRRVNTFEDFRTELVEGKEKKAGEELIQEVTKKQKVEDNKETAELK